MKKILFLLALILLVSFVMAIDGNNNDTNTDVITCTTEGQSMPVYPGYACCSGLVAINPQTSEEPIVGASICSNCGNEVCEQWENQYNCPNDCEEKCLSCCKTNTDCEDWFGKDYFCEFNSCLANSYTTGTCIQKPQLCTSNYQPVCGCNGITYSNDCARQAAGITKNYDGACKTKCAQSGAPVFSNPDFGPTICCSKNDGIKPVARDAGNGKCIAPNNGQLGTCVDNWWRTCGDGLCDIQNEDSCNCSKDCGNTKPPILKEQVKCIFNNANERQKCYAYYTDNETTISSTKVGAPIDNTNANFFSCTTGENGNYGTCVADVKAPKGTKLTWKSSCGGYSNTIVDGENEYVKFECTNEKPPICACTKEYAPVCGTINVCETTCENEIINLNSTMKDNSCTESCYREKRTFGNACMAECAGAEIVSKGECEQTCPIYEQPYCPNGKIEVNYDEKGCKKPRCVAEEAEHFTGAYWQCSNGKEFKEVDTCMPYSFWKNKARNTCAQYSTKCATSESEGGFGNGTTTTTQNRNPGTGNFVLDAIATVTGTNTTTVDSNTTTKCIGGEVYVSAFETFGSCTPGREEKCKYYINEDGCKVKECTDGTREEVCSVDSNIITTNTYRKAYWQCYSGKEFYEGGESSCKSTDLWKQYAEESCNSECNTTEAIVCDIDSNVCETSTVKCGVNSFRVSAPCYDGKPIVCSSQDEKELGLAKQKCYANGGEMIVEIDSQGCRSYVCGIESKVCSSLSSIPKEKKINCEERGGELLTKTDENGCLTYFECIGEQINDENASINKEILTDTTKLLDLAIKIESAKIELENTANKIREIASYYEEAGKMEDANRFYKAANILEAAAQKLEEIKLEIKNNVDNFGEEKALRIRELIRNIKEDLLKEALLEMLG